MVHDELLVGEVTVIVPDAVATLGIRASNNIEKIRIVNSNDWLELCISSSIEYLSAIKLVYY
jgi:hypothetical protein